MPSRKTKSAKPSRYWIFLGQELKRLNESEGLPPGQKHHISTAPEIRRSIRERWFAMSKDEQVAATEDGYQQTLARLTRSGTTQTARLIRQIGERLELLKEYKGSEFAIVMVTRAEKEPTVFHSSHHVQDFWKDKFQTSLEDTAKEMKHYINTAQRIRPSARELSVEELQEMLQTLPKAERTRGLNTLRDYDRTPTKLDVGITLTDMITRKLREHTGSPTTRMQYTKFDEKITKKYGIIIENWPPVQFVPLSWQSNMRETLTLYHAWKSGSTKFRKLSEEEKRQWDETRARLKKERAATYGASYLDGSVAKYMPAYLLDFDHKAIGTVDQIAMFMDAPFVLLRKWQESGDPRASGIKLDLAQGRKPTNT